jgi:DNA-binding protein HU-beta
MEKRLAMAAFVRATSDQVKLRLTCEKPRICSEKIKKISCATNLARFNTQRVARLNALTTIKQTNSNTMAKALSKSQIAAAIAEKNGITKRQAQEIMETLVDLAYKNAKNSFTIPGLGKLVLVNRKARVGRNPATGESINIPAKRVVKFRVAKAAKDAILGAK